MHSEPRYFEQKNSPKVLTEKNKFSCFLNFPLFFSYSTENAHKNLHENKSL